jgi:hypothetical protein
LDGWLRSQERVFRGVLNSAREIQGRDNLEPKRFAALEKIADYKSVNLYEEL